jgi:glycosyltransferase involved in cell wall biosynthesis
MGYGEENDLCIRAGQLGFELAIADDTYVFHAKSKSFGVARKKELSRLGREQLDRKYGRDMMKAIISQLENNEELKHIREKAESRFSKLVNKQHDARNIKYPLDTPGLGILFLLPCKGYGGGIHSVIQEALGLKRIGIRARVVIRHLHLSHYLEIYKEVDDIRDLLVPIDMDDKLEPKNVNELIEACSAYNVIVATIYSSIKLLRDIYAYLPDVVPAYYIQDYEPFFSPPGTIEHQEALASYSLIPDIIAFAKTDWLVETVNKRHRLVVNRVSPSIDHSVYKPRFESFSPSSCHVVSAMIRPATPRRGAQRTMSFLRDLHSVMKQKIQIELFGCEETDPSFQKLTRNFPYVNHGRIRREEVASILARSTMFLDLSDYQAFGRTGLEAMASGCIPVLPNEGGVHEYAKHMHNSLIIDTRRANEFVDLVVDTLGDTYSIQSMRINGVFTASRYSIIGASISILKVLYESTSLAQFLSK